jgi:hypothetical protein
LILIFSLREQIIEDALELFQELAEVLIVEEDHAM